MKNEILTVWIWSASKLDGLGKSQKKLFSVVPARLRWINSSRNPGIPRASGHRLLSASWGFAGVTASGTFYR